MLIFDAHLDLAMNALEWNRDLTKPTAEIRRREQGQSDKPDRGRGTVSLTEMRRGGIGLCVATQIARYVHPGNPLPGWHSPEIAWAQTQGQLAWYRAMETAGEMVQITDAAGLRRHIDLWTDNPPSKTPGKRRSATSLASKARIRFSRRGIWSKHMRPACGLLARPTTVPALTRMARIRPAVWGRAAGSCWQK